MAYPIGLASWRRGRARAMHSLALLLLPLLVVALVAGPARADVSTGQVAVQYQLLAAYDGPAQIGGRIIVFVSNRSGHALPNITLRLADPTVGRVTGPVQQDVTLAAGETRRLEGEFVLATNVVRSAKPLEWLVVYSDAQGYAQQLLVRGEPAPTATR